MKDAGQQHVPRSHYHTAQAKIKMLHNMRALPAMQESWLLPGEHNWGIFKVIEMLEKHLKKTEGIG